MTEPITEKRTGERRSDWHSPDTCVNVEAMQSRFAESEQRFSDGTARMKRIEESIDTMKVVQADIVKAHARFEEKLDANTAKTDIAASSTAEILEIISTAKGFFKGAGYLGMAVKWALGIATAIAAFWFSINNGKP